MVSIFIKSAPFLSGLVVSLTLQSQVHTNESLEKWQIGESIYIGSGITEIPDSQTVLISNTQGHPLYLYNLAEKKIEREINISGYFAGPRLDCSADGDFVLLTQQLYIDWNQNRDKDVEIEVLDLESGNKVFTTENVHDAVWHPTESKLAVLKDEEIEIFSIPDGKSINSIKLKNRTYAICFTPDGSQIITAHQPEKDDLNKVPSLRADRKSWKPALKFRQMLSVLDSESGEFVKTVPEIYDVVYRMRISADEKRLFIYAREHTKISSNGIPNGYISQLGLETLTPLRTGFLTHYIEPDFKDSPDGKYFAHITKSGGYTPEIQICDRETGKILQRADLTNSLGHAMRKKEYGDSRAYFIWTSGTELLILYGNHLLKWQVL